MVVQAQLLPVAAVAEAVQWTLITVILSARRQLTLLATLLMRLRPAALQPNREAESVTYQLWVSTRAVTVSH